MTQEQRLYVGLREIRNGLEGLVVLGLIFATTSLSLHAQTPNLSFAPAVTYSSKGNGAKSAAVADLNGDGKPDMVVANQCTTGTQGSGCTNYAGSLGVLLGNGDGTFQAAVTYRSGMYDATSVAVADVNGDGRPDLVVTNFCSNSNCNPAGTPTVGVLLGNGNGTFQTAVTYSLTGYAPLSVVVADVNGDGKPDLVVSIYCASLSNCNPFGPGAVDVLLGNGDGTFQAAVAYGSGGFAAESVAVADVNGDGKPDIVVTNCGSNTNCTNGTVGVLLGDGNGTFQTAVSYSASARAYSAAVADVNGDGKPDLIVANTNGVDILLGNGDGTFQAAGTYGSGGSAAQWVAVADVSGDGKPDLVVVNNCGAGNCTNGNVGVLLGNGDGTFQTAVTYGSAGYGTDSVAVADVNGDGKPDLLVVNYSCSNTCSNATVSVFINTSVGPTTTGAVSSLNPSGFGQAVTLTATVRAQGFKGIPTGTVTFKDGSTTLGTGTLNGSGVATYSTSTLAVGSHSITAVYGGDTNNAASTSSVLTQTVNAASATTTTSVVSSSNPAVAGSSVTLTATVATSGSNTPTGMVTFKDGTTVLGTGTLNGSGVATYTTSTLAAGQHSITAVYGGDANNLTSTSSTLSQTVSPTDFTLSINPASATIPSGQTATYTLTVTPQGSFTSQVSFACGSLPTMATCTFAPPTLTPNTNTVTTTLMISTLAHSLLLPPSPRGHGPVIYPLGIAAWALAVAGFLLFGTSAIRKQQQLYRRLLFASGLLILTGTIAGCALHNTSNPYTPPGTSQVQITASAPASASGSNAAVSHTTAATLVVQ